MSCHYICVCVTVFVKNMAFEWICSFNVGAFINLIFWIIYWYGMSFFQTKFLGMVEVEVRGLIRVDPIFWRLFKFWNDPLLKNWNGFHTIYGMWWTNGSLPVRGWSSRATSVSHCHFCLLDSLSFIILVYFRLKILRLQEMVGWRLMMYSFWLDGSDFGKPRKDVNL